MDRSKILTVHLLVFIFEIFIFLLFLLFIFIIYKRESIYFTEQYAQTPV